MITLLNFTIIINKKINKLIILLHNNFILTPYNKIIQVPNHPQLTAAEGNIDQSPHCASEVSEVVNIIEEKVEEQSSEVYRLTVVHVCLFNNIRLIATANNFIIYRYIVDIEHVLFTCTAAHFCP